MKTILELIFVVVVIYFGYQFLTGKNSVMSKPYDCDTELAQVASLSIMFKEIVIMMQSYL